MLTFPIGIRGLRLARPAARSGLRVGPAVRVGGGLGVGLEPDTRTGSAMAAKRLVSTGIHRLTRSGGRPRLTPVWGFPTGVVG
jgi:hypothetical protein